MKYFLFGLIIFSGLNCSNNSTNINSDEDKIAADKIASSFYEAVRVSRLENTLPVLSNDFFLYTSKQEYVAMMENFKSATGNLIRYELGNWDTQTENGKHPSGSYHLQYKVYYEKDTATETFNLIKESEEIKIIGYQINSKKLTPVNKDI
jgi:hypothetical protein